MKISASIYSDPNRTLEDVVKDLDAHGVDLLHVDCNDNLGVFEDIQLIRQICDIAIDLHIITENPEKYYDLLRQNPVEFVTFQYEDLKSPLVIPKDIPGYKGLAITTPTPVEVFDTYSDFDFLLVMATIPGQSGGVFDAVNFRKIRDFAKKYPKKRIHVDGGVNAEVSFILRNLGVYVSVSGSYLFKGPSVGNALMNLTKREVQSSYHIKDFCRTREESPIINLNELSLGNTLKAIDAYGFGFVLIEDENQQFLGLISMADIRRGLLKHLDNPSEMDVSKIINSNPVTVNHQNNVKEMLSLIRRQSFPITYLPVIDEAGKTYGMLSFVNLIKGEF